MSKEQTPFTLIPDDIIRSPKLTSSELHLYILLASYCRKKRSDEPKVSRATQEIMAGIMKVSVRHVHNLLQKLQAKGLLEITYPDESKRRPVYTVVTKAPPDFCPPELQGAYMKDAISYVKGKGGVSKLQRKRLPKRSKRKRTGYPEGHTGGFTLEDPQDAPGDDITDDLGDDSGPQTPISTESDSLTPGTGVQGDPELEFHGPGTGVLPTRNSSSGIPGTGVPAYPELEFCPYKSTDESDDKRPKGAEAQRHVRALALRVSEPPPAEPPPPEAGTKTSIFRAAPNEVAPEDDSCMAQPTEEERQAELARLKALRKGPRSRITDVTSPSTQPAAPSPDAPRKRYKGAGPPPKRNFDSTADVIHNYLSADPNAISEVPEGPWALHVHFRRAVKSKYPGARFPKDGGPKYLRWAKELLRDYSRKELYEMIRLLVFDYENIKPSRVFFKNNRGSPTPTFDLFYSNAVALQSLIGKGIISPPAVRYSPYADDYAKRHGQSADITPNQSGEGKTEVDPIDALRDQIN